MRKLLIIILLLALHLTTQAQEGKPSLYITGAWARPAVMASAVSAIYMTIENVGDSAMRLVNAATQFAAEAQIHETEMIDNIMRMRHIEGIDIPPGESAVLGEGGLHIMLIDLQHDLVAGEAISLDLLFETPDSADSFILTIGVPVLAEAPPASDFVVLDAWARPTAISAEATPEADMHGHQMTPGEAADVTITSDVSAVYLSVLNRGQGDDRIIAARSDAAGMVEIHESRMQDGVMRMRPIEAIELALNELAVLQPGGLHIMMMNLERGLVAGDAIMVTLVLESGLELPVAVPVRDNLTG